MTNYDLKLFVPKTKQPQLESLCTPSISQGKKPIVLFTKNILRGGIGDYISKEDSEILDTFFVEADKEDLYGSEDKDNILNENEQKTFLKNLKEKHPNLYEIVNNFVEKLQIKSNEEKIAKILYLKKEDYYMEHNEQLITYGLEYLNNDNLMSVSRYYTYDETCLLYQLYAEAQSRVELNEDYIDFIEENYELYVKNGDLQGYERDINRFQNKKNQALKDLEIIKEKSLDYANHVIQLARKNNVYIKDYEQALEKAIENNDIKNIAIYTQRLSDRVFISSGNVSKRATELKEPNGQIDTAFLQGYTGDCWFLSALKSMCGNSDALERINNMITVNKEGNTITSVTVNIQGKNYTIDYENLENANEYATGDLDVRALEMALNQHMHDNNLGMGDITLGGFGNDAYKFLFGEDNVELAEYKKETEWWYEFDSEKYLNTLKGNKDSEIMSCLLTGSETSRCHVAEDINGNEVGLPARHAYCYSKIDDHFLFITDPHAPEQELKIPLERVGKVFRGAYTAKLKNNK